MSEATTHYIGPVWMEDIPTDDVEYMTGLDLKSNIEGAVSERIFYYRRGLAGNPMFEEEFPMRTVEIVTKPILVLLHGYPQTNFMWRHIVPLLPKDIPLLIPDVYGYGRSRGVTTRGPHGNAKVAKTIRDFIRNILAYSRVPKEHPIIIVGHDRGARLCHRLATDASHTKTLNVVGTVLLDIVPTLVQYQSFSTPSSSVGTFHWPFLANVELATEMIKAYGGDKWAKMCIDRWAGTNEDSLSRLRSNKAIEKYGQFFNKAAVIIQSCQDYRAGSDEDVKAQEKDQEQGRKIDIDVLVLYSEDYLGTRYDVRKVWEEWMGKGNLEVRGIGGGCGHFVAEEKAEETAEAILGFYERFDDEERGSKRMKV